MNIENQPEEVIKLTLGQRLQKGREELGMSQEDMAEQLCLRLSIIRDIETDCNSDSVPDVFWRGYIRSYAKQINLSDAEIAEYLTQVNPASRSNKQSMRNFSQKENIKKRDKWLMITTVIIFLITLGLTGIWWWQEQDEKKNGLTIMVDDATTLNEPAYLIHESPDAIIPTPSENITVEKEPEGSLAMLTENRALPENEMAVEKPSSVDREEVEKIAATISVPALEIKVNEECWIEIRDASSNKVIYTGLARKGRTLSFEPEISYRLTIGVPSAVEVRHNGKEVELTQFIKERKVARVTLAQGN